MYSYWVDLVILVVIGLSVLTGIIRGLVKEVLALGIWILAIWLAFNYSEGLDPWLQHYIQDKTARMVVGFIAIMVGTLIAGGLFNALLGYLLKQSGLSSTDRILGMGFGFVRGVFIVSFVMVVMQMTSMPIATYKQSSVLYAKFDPMVAWLYGYTPALLKKIQTLESVENTKSLVLKQTRDAMTLDTTDLKNK